MGEESAKKCKHISHNACRAIAQSWLVHFQMRVAELQAASASSAESAAEALEAGMKLSGEAQIPSGRVSNQTSPADHAQVPL